MTTAITAPGTISAYDEYYLANDLVSSFWPVLTVNSYCRINGNGKRIIYTGTDSAANPSIGILINTAAPYQVNISGLSFSGVRFGVKSLSPYTRLQYGVDFSGCRYCGASLEGDYSNVQYCIANGIGGVSDDAYAIAFNIVGSNCLVEFNDLRNIYRQTLAAPSLTGEGCPVIINAAATGCTVRKNFIANDTPQPHTIGVFGGQGGAHTIDCNSFRNLDIGIEGGGTTVSTITLTGNTIWMQSGGGTAGIQAAYGNATGNLIVGYGTPFSGSITQTGNTVYP